MHDTDNPDTSLEQEPEPALQPLSAVSLPTTPPPDPSQTTSIPNIPAQPVDDQPPPSSDIVIEQPSPSQPKQTKTQPPVRRNARSRNRPGRPPNINENSLMRRLECVMAVDSGRMNMLAACQQYEISARTFYRWLRNKDRLIELTGFTEEDFKHGSPLPDKDNFPHQNTQRMPPQRADPEQNLPRLPAQPVVPTNTSPSKEVTPPHPFAGSKRRLPRATDKDFTAPPNHNPAFYRRNFTKMPSQPKLPRHNTERQPAPASAPARVRRDSWPQQTSEMETQFAPQPFDNNTQPSSPDESFKRRKLQKVDDTPVETVQEAHDPLLVSSMQQDLPPTEDNTYVNGAANHTQIAPRTPGGSAAMLTSDVLQAQVALQNGTPPSPTQDTVFPQQLSDVRQPQKHRLEIMMGRRRVCIAWYDGAQAEDIRTAIARRFALLPGTQWALMDKGMDEIIISTGVPSGRYTLTVFS